MKSEIENLKRDLVALFGRDDAIVKGLELKLRYIEIGEEFKRVREFQSYEISLDYVCEQFHVSKSTAKRAISFQESLVQNNELT